MLLRQQRLINELVGNIVFKETMDSHSVLFHLPYPFDFTVASKSSTLLLKVLFCLMDLRLEVYGKVYFKMNSTCPWNGLTLILLNKCCIISHVL